MSLKNPIKSGSTVADQLLQSALCDISISARPWPSIDWLQKLEFDNYGLKRKTEDLQRKLDQLGDKYVLLKAKYTQITGSEQRETTPSSSTLQGKFLRIFKKVLLVWHAFHVVTRHQIVVEGITNSPRTRESRKLSTKSGELAEEPPVCPRTQTDVSSIHDETKECTTQ